MSQQTNLKALERRLLLSYHQDGILDLVAGTAILVFAGVAYFDQPAFIGLMAIPGSLYIALKQRVSIPRSGLVRFDSAKEQKRKISLTMLAGLATLLGLIVFYLRSGAFSEAATLLVRDYIFFLFGAVFGTGLAAIGYFLTIPRFYRYAVSGTAAVWIAGIFSIDIGIGIALVGLIVVGVGASLLARFVKNNPLSRKGA